MTKSRKSPYKIFYNLGLPVQLAHEEHVTPSLPGSLVRGVRISEFRKYREPIQNPEFRIQKIL